MVEVREVIQSGCGYTTVTVEKGSQGAWVDEDAMGWQPRQGGKRAAAHKIHRLHVQVEARDAGVAPLHIVGMASLHAMAALLAVQLGHVGPTRRPARGWWKAPPHCDTICKCGAQASTPRRRRRRPLLPTPMESRGFKHTTVSFITIASSSTLNITQIPQQRLSIFKILTSNRRPERPLRV